MTIQTMDFSMLEIFAKSAPGKDGSVTLHGPDGTKVREEAGRNQHRFIRIPLERGVEYRLDCSDCQISIAYLSGSDDPFTTGICFLEDGHQIDHAGLTAHYHTPYREQYHFNPYKNWINDPNGLCWYQGYYHLFYQANPNEQKWDDMYWGHAVSKDLMHWVHQPFVLTPQPELLEDPTRKGGAFSGCAVPFEDRVVFYLTRHDGPQTDSSQTLEWQTMTSSTDLLHFQPEVEIIRKKPEGAGHDFRDPKVIKIGDWWYMVLGSNLNRVSAILLYRSQDMEHWEYRGPLLMEPDPGSSTIECPDFFYLDGKYVADGALMTHVDDHGRRQMTRCYIGDFQNEKLQIEHTHWYDFGSNFYAVQSFEHEGRRIAIGWVSDFNQEHQTVPDGAYGSMSLPRELHVEQNRLTMRPVKEVYSLIGEKLYSGCGMVGLPKIKGNSYYVKAEFTGDTDFSFLLAENGTQSIWLKREAGVTRIETVNTAAGDLVQFPAEISNVRTVEIFADRRTYEVYLNHGEAAGTRIFYPDSTDGIFSSKVDQISELKQIEVYAMNSIW